MVRVLGALFLILIIIELATHMNGHVWVAVAFYATGGAFVIGLFVYWIRRYWW